MNIIGKIIGVILLIFLIFILINFKTILPFFDNLALGGGTKTPYQIGTAYVDQILASNPYKGYTTYNNSNRAITYGSFLAQKSSKKGKVTAEKQGNILYITTEYVSVPTSLGNAVHLWLTNTETISNNTSYIDLGVARNGSIQTYTTDIGSEQLSLQEYKYVMIINIEDFTIYSQSVLRK